MLVLLTIQMNLSVRISAWIVGTIILVMSAVVVGMIREPKLKKKGRKSKTLIPTNSEY
jgi:hypothetical protein